MKEYKYYWKHLKGDVDGFCYIKCDSLEHFVETLIKMQRRDKGTWEYWL